MPTPSNILLIHENPALAEEIQGYLIGRGYSVEWVMNEEQAVNGIVSMSFDVLITAIQSSKIDGLRLLDIAKERNSTTPVLLLMESNQLELGIQGLERGATNVVTTPFHVELLERYILQGLEHQATQYDMFQLKRQLDTHHGLPNLVGQSHTMASLHDQIRQSASSPVPVIITGESGTGKDHIAQTIHNQSGRSRRAFTKVVFDVDHHDTVQRDLFGYAPGVYSDAPEGHAGQIESADEGTLYLDNLNLLSPIQRDQLLQCLEARHFQRLGDTRDISVDIRLIVSITSPLDTDDMTGDFLNTLQQKYGALTLDLPPLRNHQEDIAALLEHFLTIHTKTQQKALNGFGGHVVDALTRYPWPENVRELNNAVEHMVLNTPDGSSIDYTALPLAIREHPAVNPDHLSIPRGSDLHTVERILIEDTMNACNNNKEECAKTLGIGLRTLYRKLKEYESS